MTHSEAVTLATAFAGGAQNLDQAAMAGAKVYLDLAGGAVQRSELVRVLAQHLEVGHEVAAAAISRLAAAGKLRLADQTVALPAGRAARDIKEK